MTAPRPPIPGTLSGEVFAILRADPSRKWTHVEVAEHIAKYAIDVGGASADFYGCAQPLRLLYQRGFLDRESITRGWRYWFLTESPPERRSPLDVESSLEEQHPAAPPPPEPDDGFPKCETCMWWKKQSIEGYGEGVGICRRNAPRPAAFPDLMWWVETKDRDDDTPLLAVIAGNRARDDGRIVSYDQRGHQTADVYFPRMWRSDGCGEHKAKESP